MNLKDYSISASGSLLLHAIILFLLFFSWGLSKKETLETPSYVKAELVKLTSEAKQAKPLFQKATEQPQPEPEPEPEKPVAKTEPEPERREEIERERIERQQQEKQQEKQQQEKLKKEKELKEKKKKEKELAERKKREEAERIEREQQARDKAEREKAEKERAAAEKRKADEALAKAMAEEEAYRQSLQDKQTIQSYADLIRRRVEQNWSRPPSAKKGMEVLLEIQLVPTGYVTGVSIIRSSGNPSFDLSAQQAVQKANRFPELKDMPPRVFEQHFRRFKMLFRVEDQF